MPPNFAQPIDNRTDADIPLSFVSLLRWCEERNVAPEPLPDSDEAKRLRSEFIAHVERLGGIADAATFQREGWADEPYRSIRSRAKQLCRRLAVGHGEVPRACLDPQPCYWPLKPLKTDRDLLSWLCERLEQLDSGTNVLQLKHRCVAMIEAMRIAHGWLEQRRIFNAPRCAVTEIELNDVFTIKFNPLGWSNTLPPNTVVEALVRDLVNQIRHSFLDLLSWLQDRVGSEREPDSDGKSAASHSVEGTVRTPSRLQLDNAHEAALECLRTAHIAYRLIIPWAVPIGNRDKKMSELKRLQTELENALQRFDEVWTADVARWFYLYRPKTDARFGKYLTAAEHVRDCCDKALFAVGTAIEVGAADLEEARSVLRLDRPSVTDAILHDEWSAAYRNLESAGERTPEAKEPGSTPGGAQMDVLPDDDGANRKQSTEAEFVFRPDRNGYELRWRGESEHVPANRAKGLHDFYQVVNLRCPIPLDELAAGPKVNDPHSQQLIATGADLSRMEKEGRRLMADIEVAESDLERSELQTKFDDLTTAIKAMKGLNGKLRDMNNPLDKIRPKVLDRKKTAVARIREHGLPDLADHFDLAINTKGGCLVYEPAFEVTWDTSPIEK